MQISLSVFFIIFSFSTWGKCSFRSDLQKVISLSGPVTVALKELGLLNSDKLQGISVFHPVSSGEFMGKIYPGGVFLSRTTLKDFTGGVVFYDEGRELKKLLLSMPRIHAIEIKSRHLSPLEVIKSVNSILKTYLTGCDPSLLEMEKRAVILRDKILKSLPDNLTVLFYLGELQEKKSPDLIMANDGVVKVLRKKIKTYPSELPYVNWSSRILRTLPSGSIHVGLKDSGRTGEKKISRSTTRMTVTYPGILIPGYSQLEGFLYWAQGR